MPAYLCHGFRWQRRSIRVFVVVQNLDDASPEWIIPTRSSQCMLEAFYNLFNFVPYCVPPSRHGSGDARELALDIGDDEAGVFSTAAYSTQPQPQPQPEPVPAQQGPAPGPAERVAQPRAARRRPRRPARPGLVRRQAARGV
jgi:hypothetical protein